MILYGKKEAVGRLSKFRRSGRFPHGILFCGDEGCGKGVLADYTAMLYLCKEGKEAPCFSCNECKRIAERAHPDVIYADGKECKAADMRQLVRDGYNLPNDGAVRVFIIKNLDLTAPVCQNILLKFIEEPLDFNRFVFTAGGVSGILPTVLSRLSRINVPPPTPEECAAALTERGASPSDAAALSEKYRGNIGKCLDYISSVGKGGERFSPFETAQSIIESIIEGSEYKTAVKLRSLSSRDEINAVLPLLLEMFRDGAALQCGSPQPVSFDKTAGARLGRRYSLKKLCKAAEIIEKYTGISGLAYNLDITANAFTAELFGILI